MPDILQIFQMRDTEAEHLEWLLGQRNIPPRANILDIGCGTGALAATILKQRSDVHITLVNPNKEQLNRAPDSCFKIAMALNDPDLPYELPHGEYDVIICDYCVGFVSAELLCDVIQGFLADTGTAYVYDMTSDWLTEIMSGEYRIYPCESLKDIAKQRGYAAVELPIAETPQIAEAFGEVLAAETPDVQRSVQRDLGHVRPVHWQIRKLNTMLAFSGGKDSMAVLALLEDELERIDIVYVNTGQAFNEISVLVDYIRLVSPNFTEIRTDVDTFHEDYGWPCDVLPVDSTPLGQTVTKGNKQKLIDYLSCCLHNIQQPLADYAKERGYTTVIRGDRADEHHGAPLYDGYKEDGVTYRFPLWDFSEEQVKTYLKAQGLWLPHFDLDHSSLDCKHCTAYLGSRPKQLAYMRENHADAYFETLRRLQIINQQITNDLIPLKELL